MITMPICRNIHILFVIMILPHGPEGGMKIPSQGLRAEGEARGLRDGIFDDTQGPIW